MNTINTHHAAATLVTASVVATVLTSLYAIAPTAAGAHRPDPLSGSATQCGGGIGTVDRSGSVDVAEAIAHRKSQMAQDYVDALTLRERAAR